MVNTSNGIGRDSNGGGKAPLRIFLVQSAHGFFVSSGGYRANMAFCRAMVAAGNTVKMLALPFKEDLASISDYKSDGTWRFGQRDVNIYRFEYLGIEVVGLEAEQYTGVFESDEVESRRMAWLEDKADVQEFEALREFLHGEIAAFGPTHFIMNEGISLKIAMDKAMPHPCIRIYIAHDFYSLPFGPMTVGDPAERWKVQRMRLSKVEGRWAVSEALREIICKYGRLDAMMMHNHPMIYGDDLDKLPLYDNWDKPYITAINPGAWKGFPIIQAMAKAMPDGKFLVTKSWSVTDYVIQKLQELANVTVEESKKDTEKLWCRTKILLVPSTWCEAFGLVVVEAMLRGIPVISSDAGGLVEAHLGVPWVLPVNLMDGTKETDPTLIENFGIWKVPDNDPQPWISTLRKVLDDKALYERVRREGREAAMRYVKEFDTGVFERWLRDLCTRNEQDHLR